MEKLRKIEEHCRKRLNALNTEITKVRDEGYKQYLRGKISVYRFILAMIRDELEG